MMFSLESITSLFGTELVTQFIVATIIVIYIWHKTINSPKQNKIPGPWPVPIIGNVLQFYNVPYRKFMEWSKIYGPIFKVELINEQLVIINGAKNIKELLNHKLTTGRNLDNPVVYEMTKGCYGTGNSQGRVWTEQRNFTVNALQKCGFNKSSMESVIAQEVSATLRWLSKREGQPVQAVRLFNDAVINGLWHMVAGERFDWENGQSDVVKCMGEMIIAFQKVTTNGLALVPFLRHIFPEKMGWNEYVRSTSKVQKMFEDAVEKRRVHGGGNGHDFMTSYLKEIENTNDPESSFYQDNGYKNLAVGMFDLFIGNSESSSMTLSWVLLYILHHPKVQSELHLELDKVITNPFKCPNLSDRLKLPFLEAIIMETMRMSSIVPLALPHQVTEELTFKSFKFKKGTTLLPNLYGVHHDSDVWGDPENFRPSRFLNSDKTKVVADENLMPFSVGRRKCIGEKMGREQLFLFVSGILNRYIVNLAPGCTLPDMEPEPGSVALFPSKFEVVFVPRTL